MSTFFSFVHRKLIKYTDTTKKHTKTSTNHSLVVLRKSQTYRCLNNVLGCRHPRGTLFPLAICLPSITRIFVFLLHHFHILDGVSVRGEGLDVFIIK